MSTGLGVVLLPQTLGMRGGRQLGSADMQNISFYVSIGDQKFHMVKE